MRIVSKFKDYYDNALGFGIDPSLLYVREIKEIDISWDPITKSFPGIGVNYSALSNNLPPICNFTVYGVIGFCGRAYPFYKFPNTTDPDTGAITKGRAFYNLDKMVDYIRSQPNTEENRSRLAALVGNKEDRRKYRTHTYWGYSSLDTNSWGRYLKEKYKPAIGDDIFRHLKAPVILFATAEGSHQPRKLIVNPNLREYDFASQVDPFRAFQEISMYLGNNLVEQKDPNPKITDELKAQSKGFDKWSFRRHKEDNKK